jgi:hypothetical protein
LFQLDALQTPIGHASMFINLSDAEKGLPPQAGVDDPDFERLTDSSRLTLGLSNHFDYIPLSLKLYYNELDNELTVYTDENYIEVDEIEEAKDYSWGGKVYSTLETSSNNSLILTGGVQSDTFKAEGALEDSNRAELTTYTVAVEDQFWINDRLSLAAGAIYSYFDQTRFASGSPQDGTLSRGLDSTRRGANQWHGYGNMTRPPLATSVWPTMKLDASDSR